MWEKLWVALWFLHGNRQRFQLRSGQVPPIRALHAGVVDAWLR
jgi:hypothetical protein